MTFDYRAQQIIGRCIRTLREQRRMTLDQLAHAAGITYQYLSGVETGKRNFTISVLDAIAGSLRASVPDLIARAYSGDGDDCEATLIAPQFLRPQVPLPPGLTIDQLAAALNQTQSIIHRINRTLRAETHKRLADFIQGNNFSGLVSNILTDSISDNSPYKHNSDQQYPDLIRLAPDTGERIGLEVKATINIGKGGESHNGHGGWHAIACYQMDAQGSIRFVHVMFAELNSHQHASPDWKYIGSKVDPRTGSRRTETYVTNLRGTTKLRDGSVYLDASIVKCKRWRQERPDGATPPSWSIFCSSTPAQ